jgi:peptidyl-prolyl cis-trans isomerase SDCCAG10
LCLEGYYDNTIFHRIVKDFLIESGDPDAENPDSNGLGGQSIYGAPFNDEFHTLLKFSHRGIVAMVNGNKTNNNGSQFFITLKDKCPWLDRKHTIFGKVTGDTFFNLAGIESEEVDTNDRPLNPPRIKSCEVVLNPFDDIIPRETKKSKSKPVEKPKVKCAVKYE